MQDMLDCMVDDTYIEIEHTSHRRCHLRHICPELVQQLPEILAKSKVFSTPLRTKGTSLEVDMTATRGRPDMLSWSQWPRHPTCQSGWPTDKKRSCSKHVCVSLAPSTQRLVDAFQEAIVSVGEFITQVRSEAEAMMTGPRGSLERDTNVRIGCRGLLGTLDSQRFGTKGPWG